MSQPQADGLANRQRDINAGIIALALNELAGVWPQIDWGHPQAAAAVKQLYGAIVTKYGQAAASVSALLYDEVRGSADVPQGFTATPADPIPQAQLDKIVDSAFLGSPEPIKKVSSSPEPTTKPAETSNFATTSDLPVEQRVPQRLEGSATRLIQQPGRDTIVENVARDPVKPRWVRVPTSAKPCAFCVLLASRQIGPSFRGYTSELAAGGEGNKYHDHCMCVPIPVFAGLEDTFDLTPYQNMYQKAAADVGSARDPKPILAAMRQMFNLK